MSRRRPALANARRWASLGSSSPASSNGRTEDFGSSYRGSNPCAGTEKPRTSEGSSEGHEAHDAAIARLAAKARMLERLATGDVRVLAEELREGLERLCGPVAKVVDLGARRGVR